MKRRASVRAILRVVLLAVAGAGFEPFGQAQTASLEMGEAGEATVKQVADLVQGKIDGKTLMQNRFARSGLPGSADGRSAVHDPSYPGCAVVR